MPTEILVSVLAALGTLISIALYRYVLARPQARREQQKQEEPFKKNWKPWGLRSTKPGQSTGKEM